MCRVTVIERVPLHDRYGERMAGIHVVPQGSPDPTWLVKREGDPVPVSRHATQQEATAVGRELARAEHVELLVHGRDGRIRERDSYGHDPADIPG